ncbi:hypothetical protein D6C78_08738 [Aureobasidium pullulans]|uniref:Uncharacterized protein n=1 Tax=Aureobasidium pullulans TaxID=5580 RepID=A0A4T0BBW5_AURPU|nr:hypothetical protein D6C78_08738 [Aureobasidium pullulans]
MLAKCIGTGMCLTLLYCVQLAQAQSDDDSNQNITVRFFPDTQQADTCGYGNSSNALTFTTQDIPIISNCFNFADLFGGNETTGFVNQTRNSVGSFPGGYEPGIHWELRNKDLYDPSANYSKALYRQSVSNPSDKLYEPGHYADRLVTVYGGANCTERDPNNDEGLLPWYGWACWSEGEGSCGTLPYNVVSFRISPGFDKENSKGKCWDFAEYGAANSYLPSLRTVVAAFAGALVVVSLAV